MKKKDAYYHLVLIVQDEELLHGITYAYSVEIPDKGKKTEYYADNYLLDEYGIMPGYILRYYRFDTALEAEEYAFNENTETRNDERWYKVRAEQEYKAEKDRMDTLDNLRMEDLLRINAQTTHDTGIAMQSQGTTEDKRFMQNIMEAYDKMNHDNEEDKTL